MTGIVDHKSRRINWHVIRHSYLVDIGSEIEIAQIEVSDLYENRMLTPPFPGTHFFEIEIDEVRKNGTRTFAFQNIYPVRAKRKPDWHILKVRIRRGSWTITERIASRTEAGTSQWIYTDDFNILFLSSGVLHDPGILVNLITEKLDDIVRSIRAGSRVPSEFENQRACRRASNSIFSDGVDRALRDAVVYQNHAGALTGKLDIRSPRVAASVICSNHGMVHFSNRKVAGVHVDLNQIDEMKDLSWLTD